MKITIEINCDNAAFEDHPAQEIGDILLKLSQQFDDIFILRQGRGYDLFDSNGNKVGRVEVCQ